MFIAGHQEGIETDITYRNCRFVVNGNEPTAGRHIYLEPGDSLMINFRGWGWVGIKKIGISELYRFTHIPENWTVKKTRETVFEASDVDHVQFFKNGKRIGYVTADEVNFGFENMVY